MGCDGSICGLDVVMVVLLVLRVLMVLAMLIELNEAILGFRVWF